MVKIFIGNLGDTGAITSNDLREAFEKYGPVTESECVKNYAFVHMQYKKDADDALRDLNGVVLKGNINIKIKMFHKKLKYNIIHLLTVNIITNLRNFVLQALLLVITPWVCQIHQDLTSREI